MAQCAGNQTLPIFLFKVCIRPGHADPVRWVKVEKFAFVIRMRNIAYDKMKYWRRSGVATQRVSNFCCQKKFAELFFDDFFLQRCLESLLHLLRRFISPSYKIIVMVKTLLRYYYYFKNLKTISLTG